MGILCLHLYFGQAAQVAFLSYYDLRFSAWAGCCSLPLRALTHAETKGELEIIRTTIPPKSCTLTLEDPRRTPRGALPQDFRVSRAGKIFSTISLNEPSCPYKWCQSNHIGNRTLTLHKQNHSRENLLKLVCSKRKQNMHARVLQILSLASSFRKPEFAQPVFPKPN